ncbi:hypothetical protein [Haloferula sp. A504]|uniref:hypothetical protein n=1 Tax=Haloferula sp. A504 TaxID=3373601 RepID=UPI0031C2F3E0|nr:hypothetical protein [Verrucomicrobiaceae bacterium E54]
MSFAPSTPLVCAIFLGLNAVSGWSGDSPLPYVVPAEERAAEVLAPSYIATIGLTTPGEREQAMALIEQFEEEEIKLISRTESEAKFHISGALVEDLVKKRISFRSLTPTLSQVGTVARSDLSYIEMDQDGDQLTDTEERWWGTNPSNPDTDGDGVKDGQEIRQLRSGDTSSGIPWPNWPIWGQRPNANPGWGWGDEDEAPIVDLDQDSIPDAAERFVLGFNPYRESTDNDRYDDGQEFWGITQINRGSLPRAVDSDFLLAEMPNFVDAPGNSPLVAAYPDIKIKIPDNTITVTTRQVITSESKEINEQENVYETTTTEENVERTFPEQSPQLTAIQNQLGNALTELSTSLSRLATSLDGGQLMTPASPESGFQPYSNLHITQPKCNASLLAEVQENIGFYQHQRGDLLDSYSLQVAELATAERYRAIGLENVTGLDSVTLSADAGASVEAGWSKSFKGIGKLSALGKAGGGVGAGLTTSISRLAFGFSDTLSGQREEIAERRGKVALTESKLGAIEADLNRQYELLGKFATCDPGASGRSLSRSLVVSRTEPDEPATQNFKSQRTSRTTSRNYQRIFNRTEWSHATTTDTSHAADLTFDIEFKNAGTDVVREISSVIANVYIGESEDVAKTVILVGGGSGVSSVTNLFPGAAFRINTPVTIPLTLEQTKEIDLGNAIRVEIVRVEYGDDQLFYENAYTGGVYVMVDNGVDDGNEEVRPYLIPTWGDETYMDVLSRIQDVVKFEFLSNGAINYIELPEMNGQGRIIGSKRYPNSENSAWAIYSQGPDGRSFGEMTAEPESSVMLKFFKDEDQDGYLDREELRYGTDMQDPTDAPSPRLIAGYVDETAADGKKHRTLVIKNVGNYPATDIEAVTYSPDESVEITNNISGVGGYIHPGQKVVLGPRFTGLNLEGWRGTGVPAFDGIYKGDETTTYTFTVTSGGNVGAEANTVTVAATWGASGATTLNFGDGYEAPGPQAVGPDGLQLGFSSGNLKEGDTFQITANPYADSFAYAATDSPVLETIIGFNSARGHNKIQVSQMLATRDEEPEDKPEARGTHVKILMPNRLAMDQPALPYSIACYNGSQLDLKVKMLVELVRVKDGVSTLMQTASVTDVIPYGQQVIPSSIDLSSLSGGSVAEGDNLLLSVTMAEDGVSSEQSSYIDSAMGVITMVQTNESGQLFAMNSGLDLGDVQLGENSAVNFIFGNNGDLPNGIYLEPLNGSVSSAGLSDIWYLERGDLGEVELLIDTSTLGIGDHSIPVRFRSLDGEVYDYNILIHVDDSIGGSVVLFPVENRPWELDMVINGPVGLDQEVVVVLPEKFRAKSFEPIGVYDRQETKIVGGQFTPNFATSGARRVESNSFTPHVVMFPCPQELQAGDSARWRLKMGQLVTFGLIESVDLSDFLTSPSQPFECDFISATQGRDPTDVFYRAAIRTAGVASASVSFDEELRELNLDVSDNLKLPHAVIAPVGYAESQIYVDLDCKATPVDKLSFDYSCTGGAIAKLLIFSGGQDELVLAEVITIPNGQNRLDLIFDRVGGQVDLQVDGQLIDTLMLVGSEWKFGLGAYAHDTNDSSASVAQGTMRVSQVFVDDDGFGVGDGQSLSMSANIGQYGNASIDRSLRLIVDGRDQALRSGLVNLMYPHDYNSYSVDYSFANYQNWIESLVYTGVNGGADLIHNVADGDIGDSLRYVSGTTVDPFLSLNHAISHLTFGNISFTSNSAQGVLLHTQTINEDSRVFESLSSEGIGEESSPALEFSAQNFDGFRFMVGNLVTGEEGPDYAIKQVTAGVDGQSLDLVISGSVTEDPLVVSLIGREGFLISSEFVVPVSGGDLSLNIPVPNSALGYGENTLTLKVETLLEDSDLSNNSMTISSANGFEFYKPYPESVEFDCGNGVTEAAYFANGDGYLDGSAFTWGGDLQLETVRMGFGGEVSYRFDSVDPAASYALSLSHYQPDSMEVSYQIYADGFLMTPIIGDRSAAEPSATIDLNQNGAGITAFATAYLPAAAIADGSVTIKVKSVGPYPASVSSIALHRGRSLFVDCGLISADPPYGEVDSATGIAFGHTGPMSIPYGSGASSIDTRRYAPGSTLSYRFSGGGLDAFENAYVVRTILQSDAPMFVRRRLGDSAVIDVDPLEVGAQFKGHYLQLSSVWNSDFTLHVDRVDEGGNPIVGPVSIVDLELLEFPGLFNARNRDTDEDGIPDFWELDDAPLALQLSATVADSSLDHDHDGQSTLQEYEAGTDPLDGSSRFELVSFSKTELEGDWVISWTSRPDRFYVVEKSSDMLNWNRAADPVSGSITGVSNLTVPGNGEARCFFRVYVTSSSQ